MKKLFPLLIVAAFFAGCEKIEGQLNVLNNLTLKNSDGASKTIVLGTYSADINANSSKKITLRLNNDNDQKFVFTLPSGSLPSNGNFSYKSATIGQPVDLSGTVATTSSDSPRRQMNESCQYQRPVQVCFPTPNGGQTCTVRYETVFGQRWVTYFDRTTTQDVTMSIAAAGSSTESAQFQGEASWINRIIVSQNQCF